MTVSAVDFTEWAAPDLTFTFPESAFEKGHGIGGRTFIVRPPTVDGMTKVLALAIRGEVELRMVDGVTEVPAEIQATIDTIGPDEHPALGATFDEMRNAHLTDPTINRAAYYAIFHWARGKQYADDLAEQLFKPRELATAGADAPRKGL